MLFTMAIQHHLGLRRSYNDKLLTFCNDVINGIKKTHGSVFSASSELFKTSTAGMSCLSYITMNVDGSALVPHPVEQCCAHHVHYQSRC
jgi:hypothetical protein